MSVDFNDPKGWGYCECCAFMVACDTETGILLDHKISNIDAERCNGSFWPADPVPEVSVAPNQSHRYRIDRPEVRREEDPD